MSPGTDALSCARAASKDLAGPAAEPTPFFPPLTVPMTRRESHSAKSLQNFVVDSSSPQLSVEEEDGSAAHTGGFCWLGLLSSLLLPLLLSSHYFHLNSIQHGASSSILF